MVDAKQRADEVLEVVPATVRVFVVNSRATGGMIDVTRPPESGVLDSKPAPSGSAATVFVLAPGFYRIALTAGGKIGETMLLVAPGDKVDIALTLDEGASGPQGCDGKDQICVALFWQRVDVRPSQWLLQ